MTGADHQGKPPAPASPLTYRAAGVDIEAGDALVELIKPLAKATSRPGSSAAWAASARCST